MSPWICMLLISIAGALGGVVNALLSGNGFALPRREGPVWCPGFLSNIVVGAFSAFASWAFYGSGAGIELALKAEATAREAISLKASALAGAFLVGVAGAKWLTNEVDKRLLKEGVVIAAGSKPMSQEHSRRIISGTPLEVFQAVRSGCSAQEDRSG